MLEQLKEMMKEMLKDKEFFELMAKVNRAYFEALVKQGFTREEAIEIASRQASAGK